MTTRDKAMSLLTLHGVSKAFEDVTAVDDVSFSVDRGQVVGFLGPNGAGKSTTMRLITQFFDPDAGEILLDGIPLATDTLAAKRRIGYLPENNLRGPARSYGDCPPALDTVSRAG